MYDEDEVVTAYLVITKGKDVRTGIQAWSLNKQMAKFYMEFHNCKQFHLKEVRGTLREINAITEKSVQDEISIYNILTLDTDKPGKRKLKPTPTPMTGTEYSHIQAECGMFMSNDIDYELLSQAFDYMESDKQKTCARVALPEVCSVVQHNKHPAILRGVKFDELLVLYRSFPDNFGE